MWVDQTVPGPAGSITGGGPSLLPPRTHPNKTRATAWHSDAKLYNVILHQFLEEISNEKALFQSVKK